MILNVAREEKGEGSLCVMYCVSVKEFVLITFEILLLFIMLHIYGSPELSIHLHRHSYVAFYFSFKQTLN